MHSTNLVADIGGTNCRLAICQDNSTHLEHVQVYSTEQYHSLYAVLEDYLGKLELTVNKMALAVAGPVTGRHFQFTNNHWHIDCDFLEKELRCQKASLLNDFHAAALGSQCMKTVDLVPLNQHAFNHSQPQVICGPGTGLGLASIRKVDTQLIVGGSEGGQISFAPENDAEIAILQYFLRQLPYVPYEHILSGRGIINLYTAISHVEGKKAELRAAHEISSAALAGESTCRKTLLMYCDILGSYCGNACLNFGATGGLYLAGGILPKILPLLQQSQFQERFKNKDRFESYVQNTGIALITHQYLGLCGAAEYLKH